MRGHGGGTLRIFLGGGLPGLLDHGLGLFAQRLFLVSLCGWAPNVGGEICAALDVAI